MPYLKVWIHFVWATKYRMPILIPSVRRQIFAHMHETASKKKIWLDSVGGYLDHVHALVVLRGTQSLSQIAGALKGESSHWANEVGLLPVQVKWQADYAAFSVSESGVYAVRRYIRNQEDHHRKKTMVQEFEALLKEHNLSDLDIKWKSENWE